MQQGSQRQTSLVSYINMTHTQIHTEQQRGALREMLSNTAAAVMARRVRGGWVKWLRAANDDDTKQKYAWSTSPVGRNPKPNPSARVSVSFSKRICQAHAVATRKTKGSRWLLCKAARCTSLTSPSRRQVSTFRLIARSAPLHSHVSKPHDRRERLRTASPAPSEPWLSLFGAKNTSQPNMLAVRAVDESPRVLVSSCPKPRRRGVREGLRGVEKRNGCGERKKSAASKIWSRARTPALDHHAALLSLYVLYGCTVFHKTKMRRRN